MQLKLKKVKVSILSSLKQDTFFHKAKIKTKHTAYKMGGVFCFEKPKLFLNNAFGQTQSIFYYFIHIEILVPAEPPAEENFIFFIRRT